LRDKIDEIHRVGAELVIVGNGNADFAASFKKKFNLKTPLYVDPSLAVYNAAGLKRTKAGTIGPRNWLPALKALFTGTFQGRTQGDPYQQGGVFIIFPGDNLVYSYVSKRPSDRPPAKKIVEKLKAEQQKIAK
jgi:AhpC/TSA antioxidant enzyme